MGGLIERISGVVMDMEPESRDWRHYSDDAYAILRTIREPTRSMLEAGQGKIGVEAWRAMIDAALSERI
jgi:hypothetical protein